MAQLPGFSEGHDQYAAENKTNEWTQTKGGGGPLRSSGAQKLTGLLQWDHIAQRNSAPLLKRKEKKKIPVTISFCDK